jgi:hypothetical protein
MVPYSVTAPRTLRLLQGPPAPLRYAGPGRSVRLFLLRGPGPDFSDRDRALLVLLRPHLHQAYLDAEQHRLGAPQLTPRHWDLRVPGHRGRVTSQIPGRGAPTGQFHASRLVDLMTVI